MKITITSLTLLFMLTSQLNACVLRWMSETLSYDANRLAIASCKTAGEAQEYASYAGYREDGDGSELTPGRPAGSFQYQLKQPDGTWSVNTTASFSKDNAAVVVAWYDNTDLTLLNTTPAGGVTIRFPTINGTTTFDTNPAALRFKYVACTQTLLPTITRVKNAQDKLELTEFKSSETLAFHVFNKLDRNTKDEATYSGKYLWDNDGSLYQSNGVTWELKESSLPSNTSYTNL